MTSKMPNDVLVRSGGKTIFYRCKQKTTSASVPPNYRVPEQQQSGDGTTRVVVVKNNQNHQKQLYFGYNDPQIEETEREHKRDNKGLIIEEENIFGSDNIITLDDLKTHDILNEEVWRNEQKVQLNVSFKDEILRQQRESIQRYLFREQQMRPLPDSRPVDVSEGEDEEIKNSEIPISNIARQQLENGKIVAHFEQTACVIVYRREIPNFSKTSRIRKIIIGGQQNPGKNDKMVLLFGTKKVGKTSTINSMLNYLYDVKKYHNFRFALEEDIQSTSDLVEYVVNNSILPYSITFVDTPGVADIEGYTDTSSIIRKWFEERLLKEGKFCLDAITVVLKNDDEELSWPYIHELAAVKKMFGDNLKVNVLPVITYSEILPQPLAVRALAYANITFMEYYKVNNTGFLADNKKVKRNLYNLYYVHGLQAFKRYFSDLNDLEYPLLSLKTGVYVPSTSISTRPEKHEEDKFF